MIEAVIFDLGGVVLENGVYHIYEKLKRFKIIFEEKYLVSAELGEIAESELWEKISSDLGGSINPQFLKDFIFSHFTPIIGTFEIINRLQGRYKLGLLTNHLKEWFEKLEKDYRLNLHFDSIIVSAKEHLRKPDRKIYLKMVKNLNTKPENCVFIDDLIQNVRGARKIGMKAILFKNPKELKKSLRKLGVKL